MGIYDIIYLKKPIFFEYFEPVFELQTKYNSIVIGDLLYLEAHTSLEPKEETDLRDFIIGGWLELYFRVLKITNLKIEPSLYRYFPTSRLKILYKRHDIEFLANPSYFRMEIYFYDKKGKKFIARTKQLLPKYELNKIEREMIEIIKDKIKVEI